MDTVYTGKAYCGINKASPMKHLTRIFNCLPVLTVVLFTASCHSTTAKNEALHQSKNQTIMTGKNFTTTISVDRSPMEVFNAINNVRGWWSESVEGNTGKLNEEFLYYYKDVHISKMKIVELVPGKRVAWLVLVNHFNFTNDKTEWNGNRIVFDISEKNNITELRFTQEGLVPAYECYDVCRDAWTSYIQGSLKDLVTTGKGKPNAKEGGLNAELVEKWKLPNK
jgi:hypothetical protein